MTYPTLARDHFADIQAYEESVLTGVRPSGKYEKLAIMRGIDDLRKADELDGYLYYFDADAALKVIRFIETFSHIKGKQSKLKGCEKLIALSGWQKWAIAHIFGWKIKGSGLRRFTTAEIYVARKNGKSTLAAPVALYMLAADGEPGAEVYCGATSQKQANEVFLPAKKMARAQPAYLRKFGVTLHAQWIERAVDGGKFERLIGNPGDGGSPSCYIGDEYHEHPDDDQRETMTTGMGAREQPLEFIISTAGSQWQGPCGLSWKECQQLLDGVGEEAGERKFCVIYAADPDDDWRSKEAVIKANPNYGISVRQEFLDQQLKVAEQSPRKQSAYKTKHLNLWVGAKDAWINLHHWDKCEDKSLNIADFVGLSCAKGLDLSKNNDLTADVCCFDREIDGKTHYYLFARSYITEAKANEIDAYREWSEQGYLHLCDGESIDFDEVEQGVLEDVGRFDCNVLGFDPQYAAQMAQRVSSAADIEAVEVPQSYRTFSEPMREFESLLIEGRIHHNGDPVMRWCFGNVVAKEAMDGKLCRPVKEHRDNKIDVAVAGLQAFILAWRPDEDNGAAILDFLE